MSNDDWRSPDSYQYLATMEPSALAWEFLRRNPEYRSTYRNASLQADHGTDGPARRWGLRIPGRPNQRADQTPVFWHPEALADVVVMSAAPAGLGDMAISLGDWSGDIVRRDGEDGAHLLLGDGTAGQQLWVTDPQMIGSPLAAIIPLDANAARRTEAGLRLWRLIAHGPPRIPPRPHRRLGRLTLTLRVLDARKENLSYRAIAEVSFGARRIADESWKTSPLRDTVIRLARSGAAMMNGDYRKLLAANGLHS